MGLEPSTFTSNLPEQRKVVISYFHGIELETKYKLVPTKHVE